MKRVMLTMAWAMCLGCGAPTPGAGVSMGGSSSSSGNVVGSSGTAGSSLTGASSVTTGSSTADPSSSSGGGQGSSAVSPSSTAPVSGVGSASSSSGSPLPGETCQTATEISGEQMIINQTTTGYASDYDGSHSDTCVGGPSPDRVYRLGVPAHQRLDVIITPEATFDPALNLLAGPASVCNATPYECAAAVDINSDGDVEQASYVNASDQSVDVFIMVEGFRGSSGRFTLQTHLVGTVDGDVCTGAPTVTSGTLNNQTTVAYSSQNMESDTNGCMGSSAPDRVYRVEVPPGQRLVAKVTPEDTFDVALSLVAGPASTCDAANHVCLVGEDSYASGDSETVQHDNTTAITQEFFLVVDGSTSTSQGRFALDVTVGPPPPGESCHDAERITFPGVTSGTTVGFQNNVSAHRSCTGYTNDGPDHVYVVTLPAQAHARFTLHPDAAFDPSLYLLATPEMMCEAVPLVCLVGSDTTSDEVVEYTNPQASPLDIFVVVDKAYGDGGNYTLTSTAL